MKRRKFILSTAGILAIISGCITEPGSDSNNNNSNTNPEVSNYNLEIPSSNCGNEVEFSPEIDFNTESSEITINGKANGEDACQTIDIETIQYNSNENTLEVILQTRKREESDVCTQCITEINYEVIIDFENALPQNVYIEQKDMKGTNSTTISSN